MSLKDELMEIDGVGEATADKILEVVEDHAGPDVDLTQLERAVEAYENGNLRKAGIRLTQALP